MNTLDDLKKAIIAEKKMNEANVRELSELLFADGGIDKAKAEYLFSLKDAMRGHTAPKSWEKLFIDAICHYLLDDEETPGAIDDREAQWLRAKIQFDGKLGKLEKMLLDTLKSKSINFPEILHYKNRPTLMFEAVLFSTRFFTFLAVLGSMVAAIVLFVMSTMNVVEGVSQFVDFLNSGGGHLHVEGVVAIFVSSVDGYLFAMVLLIFSMGIYELFINKIDEISKRKDSRPSWLVITSIDDLKSSLGKVILMILIVQFFEHSLSSELQYKSVSDLLFLGIGILLIAAALFLTHINHRKHKTSKES